MRELKGIGHERGLDKISPESGNKWVAYPYADFDVRVGKPPSLSEYSPPTRPCKKLQ
jgi:hypothetical protein